MTEKTFVEQAELCLRTIEDNVNMGLALLRASHFNRDPTKDHHQEVVLARMREVRAFAMNWAMAADAQGIETAKPARRETGSTRKGESPVAESHAPNPSSQSHTERKRA